MKTFVLALLSLTVVGCGATGSGDKKNKGSGSPSVSCDEAWSIVKRIHPGGFRKYKTETINVVDGEESVIASIVESVENIWTGNDHVLIKRIEVEDGVERSYEYAIRRQEFCAAVMDDLESDESDDSEDLESSVVAVDASSTESTSDVQLTVPAGTFDAVLTTTKFSSGSVVEEWSGTHNESSVILQRRESSSIKGGKRIVLKQILEIR